MARFLFDENSSNYEGHRLLDDLICDGPEPDFMNLSTYHRDKVAALDKQSQVAVLRASVERMPWYRANNVKREGAICYSIACYLYARDLPYVESDICDLLSNSRHSCGHGGDVTSPFELMISCALVSGATPALMRATRSYIQRFKGVTSVQAQNIKTGGALVLLLDSETAERQNYCWSEQFRLDLPRLEAAERRYWEWFVLDNKPSQRSEMPGTTKRQLKKFVGGIGGDLVMKRLSVWFPDSRESVVPLDTGGSHLLKHFVWLLEAVVLEHSQFQQEANRLVCSLSNFDWKPREKGQKIMVTAAFYLAKQEPAVSWNALQKIECWCKGVPKGGHTGGKLEGLIRSYQEKHGCVYSTI